MGRSITFFTCLPGCPGGRAGESARVPRTPFLDESVIPETCKYYPINHWRLADTHCSLIFNAPISTVDPTASRSPNTPLSTKTAGYLQWPQWQAKWPDREMFGEQFGVFRVAKASPGGINCNRCESLQEFYKPKEDRPNARHRMDSKNNPYLKP